MNLGGCFCGSASPPDPWMIRMSSNQRRPYSLRMRLPGQEFRKGSSATAEPTPDRRCSRRILPR